MKKIISFATVAFVVLFAQSAFAATPSLSVYATGSGDQVTVSINGDANQSVLLFYNKQGTGLTIESLGTTNSSGSLSVTVYSSSLGITSGTQVYVRTGGTGGPQSNTASWPVSAESSVTLSQSSLIVSAGSSDSITATKIGSGLYVSNNSNPSVANISVNNDKITVSGNIAGTTNVTICSIGATGNCPNLSVIVQTAGANQLTFSQNSVTVVSGQTLPITISGGNGSYQITSNSNSNNIQASISGSVLNISTGSSDGSATITICSTDMAQCGIVKAQAGNASSVAVTFSSNSPSVAEGQSTNVNIYGPSGVQFYVSSNSQPSKIQANLSGSSLSLTGIASGTSEIKICASTGNCASLTATVTSASSNESISLSQNSLSLQPGQNTNITVIGGDQPYSLLPGNNSIAQGTLNGNILTVNGIAAGSTNINVCSAGGGCISVAVNVGNSGTVNSSSISLSPSSLSLSVGQTSYVTATGNGDYYLSGNSSPSVASVLVSGSSVTVTGKSAGVASITICQSGGSCKTLVATVSGSYVSTTPTISTPIVTTPAFVFTSYLRPGSENNEVMELQKILHDKGYLKVFPTGYYGPLTVDAVVDFQADNGIDQLGVVGPSTRAALNKISSASSPSSSSNIPSLSSISSMSVEELKTQAQSLSTLLAQILARITQLSGQ